MFRINSSTIVWPLILAGGCFAPLWPMLVYSECSAGALWQGERNSPLQIAIAKGK
jgi:hypothetical protein